jgi:hypothetical protein
MANKTKGPSKTSKGERKSVSTARASGAKKYTHPIDRLLDKQAAYEQGKRVWLTIPNPDPTQTNKRFIKVLASSEYGNFKERGYDMFASHEKKKEKK